MKNYFNLIKPGIVLGNLLSVISGFLLCSRGKINFFILFFLLIGTSLVIASNCVLNNIIDIEIDRKMYRTCSRVLPMNKISIKKAFFYAVILWFLGIFLLFCFVNRISVLLCIFATFIYVVVYSIFMKKKSAHATLIGGIAGSIPSIIGYTAINNHLDFCTALLFIVFLIWQIPHSYSIYIYRLNEYKKANIPVFPIENSLELTTHIIVMSIIIFIISTLMLFVFNYTGFKYLITCSIFEFIWIIYAIYGYTISTFKKWAYRLFILSIVMIIIFNIMIAIDYVTI